MKIEKKVVIPSLIVLAAVATGIITSIDYLRDSLTVIYNGCISSFGWFFLFSNLCCFIFSLWIIFGRYKNVTLGGEGSKPQFSTLSWVGMMFTTSCGAWLIVYGFLEPIYCASQETIFYGESTSRAYELGQMYAHFHWGPNAWCIYVPAAIAVGYALYNKKGKSVTLGEGVKAVTSFRGGKYVRALINIVALCGAVLAPVISIGTGMPLLVRLIQSLFSFDEATTPLIQAVILLVWILIFGTSVFLGLRRGIQNLSNINIRCAFVFMVFFGVLVGFVEVFSSEINSIGLLTENIVRLSTFADPYGEGSFVEGWTFSYWATYFVYMPMLGVFIARISRGRKLKEIALGLLVFCSIGCWVAMATFGNYAINLTSSGVVDVQSFLTSGDEAGAIVAIVSQAPFSQVLMIVLLIIMFIFLATTMDSSAFAAAEMSVAIKGEDMDATAPRPLRILWAAIAAFIAFIVIQVGGVMAVRSFCYAAGFPLAVVAVVVVLSAIKMLREGRSDEVLVRGAYDGKEISAITLNGAKKEKTTKVKTKSIGYR